MCKAATFIGAVEFPNQPLDAFWGKSRGEVLKPDFQNDGAAVAEKSESHCTVARGLEN
jgi:hypothetical protein